MPCAGCRADYPDSAQGMHVKTGSGILPDTFAHEQYLIIEENGRRIVVSGCSHRGVLNIVSWLKPDVLIGGFHFMKLDPENDGAEALKRMAAELLKYDAKYYTCQCTGVAQYNLLKSIMGDKLEYISTGNIIDI